MSQGMRSRRRRQRARGDLGRVDTYLADGVNLAAGFTVRGEPTALMIVGWRRTADAPLIASAREICIGRRGARGVYFLRRTTVRATMAAERIAVLAGSGTAPTNVRNPLV